MVLIQEKIYLKTKAATYKINLDEYKSIGTHWVTLYVNDKYVT